MTCTTTAELVDEWLDFIEQREQLAPLTVKAYAAALRHFEQAFDDVTDLSPADVEDWAHRDRRGGRQPAAATARKELVAAKKFLEWCFGRKALAVRAHVSLVMPRQTEGLPRPIPDTTWRSLWLSEMTPDDRLAVGLAYFCGLRRFEIVTMSPSAVNADLGHLVNFKRKGGKQKVLEYRATARIFQETLPHVAVGVDEWMTLLESTAAAREGEKHLSVYASADDPFLDGNRLSKRFGGQILPAAGLAPSAFTIHQLRHSCATNLWRAGLPAEDIRRFMSHSSLKTTEGYMDASGYMERRWKEGNSNE